MWSLRPSSRNLAGPPPGLLDTHPRRDPQMHVLGRRHPVLRHRRRRQPVCSTYLHIQRRRASRTVWHRPASTARMPEGIRSPRPRCRSLRPDQRHDAIALPPTTPTTSTTTRPTTERLPTRVTAYQPRTSPLWGFRAQAARRLMALSRCARLAFSDSAAKQLENITRRGGDACPGPRPTGHLHGSRGRHPHPRRHHRPSTPPVQAPQQEEPERWTVRPGRAGTGIGRLKAPFERAPGRARGAGRGHRTAAMAYGTGSWGRVGLRSFAAATELPELETPGTPTSPFRASSLRATTRDE